MSVSSDEVNARKAELIAKMQSAEILLQGIYAASVSCVEAGNDVKLGFGYRSRSRDKGRPVLIAIVTGDYLPHRAEHVSSLDISALCACAMVLPALEKMLKEEHENRISRIERATAAVDAFIRGISGAHAE